MEKKEKIFCGSGKKRKENWLSITINPDKIKDHIQEFNGNKFVKLNVNIKSEPDKYGKDVEVTIDTWQPENKAEVKHAENNYKETFKPSNTDLPF
jgi:hypothetical protein